MVAIVTGEIKVPKVIITKDILNEYTYKQQIFGREYPKTIRNYRKDNKHYYLPRDLSKFRKLISLPFEYQTSHGHNISFDMKFSPLPHQVAPINQIVSKFKGNLNILFKAPTRFGKTYSVVNVISQLKVSTLVVVDKKLLVSQFIKDTEEYSDANIIELNKKSTDTYDNSADVYITTFQFLNANKDFLVTIKDDFGMLVVDECHATGIGETYRNVIRSINSRYRLGVSATPSIPDKKLQGLLTDSFEDVEVIGEYLDGWIVDVYNYRLPRNYSLNLNIPISPQYVSYFQLPENVEAIRNLLSSLKGKRVLIATPSQELQNMYIKVAEGVGFTGAVFNSEPHNLKSKEANLKLLEEDRLNCLAGLNQLLKGWSGKLDVIIDLFSVGSQENTEQLLGRVRTKFAGKQQPIFIQLHSKYTTKKNDKVLTWLQDLDMGNYKGVYKWNHT